METNLTSEVLIERIDQRPKGGQHVGCPVPAYRCTHLATGNKVEIWSECSSHRARCLALSMFEWMEAEMRSRYG